MDNETQQLRGLFLVPVIAFYVVCIYHSWQTTQFESEVRLQLENNVLSHQDNSGGGTD